MLPIGDEILPLLLNIDQSSWGIRIVCRQSSSCCGNAAGVAHGETAYGRSPVSEVMRISTRTIASLSLGLSAAAARCCVYCLTLHFLVGSLCCNNATVAAHQAAAKQCVSILLLFTASLLITLEGFPAFPQGVTPASTHVVLEVFSYKYVNVGSRKYRPIFSAFTGLWQAFHDAVAIDELFNAPDHEEEETQQQSDSQSNRHSYLIPSLRQPVPFISPFRRQACM